jgi:palmitoyltransferase ZDHHC9/14/18
MTQQTLGSEASDSNAPSTVGPPGQGIEMSERPPPSRGTEVTDVDYQNTITTASPTADIFRHDQEGSLSSSVRPLHSKQANPQGLSVNTDKNYLNTNLPSSAKSPLSFRSSFLSPSRGGDNAGPSSPNRSTQGHEKLSSGHTSPAMRNNDTPTNTTTVQAHTGKEKNYQYFAGNTRFALGGRWQNARDRPVNLGTGFLVVLPAVLFFIFSAPWLWHHVSPAIPIVFAYIFYICFSSFLHASFSDPGVCLLLLSLARNHCG